MMPLPLGPPARLVWPAEVLAVGSQPELMTRGSHQEFLLAGMTVTAVATSTEALIALGSGRGICAVLIGGHIDDCAVADFATIVRTVAHVPVILGVERGTRELPCDRIDDHTAFVDLPVSPMRLRHAVSGVVGNAPTSAHTVARVGELELDLDARVVRWHGASVRAADLPLRILMYLIEAHPRIVPVEELERATAGDEPGRSGLARVRVAVGRLREQLAQAAPGWDPPIVTFRGHGYGIADSTTQPRALSAR